MPVRTLADYLNRPITSAARVRGQMLQRLIGDPADSCRLYAAKFRTGDMDLGIGFDAQAIFGAGRRETLRWLSEPVK